MKKFLLIVLVALILFFLIAQPTQAANLVQSILGGLKDAAEAVLTFIGNLFS